MSLSLSDLNHEETCQWACGQNDCEPKLVSGNSRIGLNAKQMDCALLQQTRQGVSPRQCLKSPKGQVGSSTGHASHNSHSPADASSAQFGHRSRDMIAPYRKRMKEKSQKKTDSFQLPENSNGKRGLDWQKKVLSNLEKKLKTLNLEATSSGVLTKSSMQGGSKFECQFADCGQLFASSVECFSHQRSHLLSQVIQKRNQIGQIKPNPNKTNQYNHCKWFQCPYVSENRLHAILHVASKHFCQAVGDHQPQAETSIGPDGNVITTQKDYLEVIEQQLRERLINELK